MLKHALCADIGGTNANFCIAEYGTRIRTAEKRRLPTTEFSDFSQLIQSYLKEIHYSPTHACFAVAGPVENNRVKMTNANLVIDRDEIVKKTDLENVLVINDFDAIGYATNVLESSEIQVINRGEPHLGAVSAAIGAGTGLGKNILIYDPLLKAHIPYSSEGGHTDLPMQFPEESFLFEHYKHPTYEDFLSGRGLERLYQILQKTKFPEEESELSAKEISKSREDSPCCNETFCWFVKFFARCAKNFAIDLLAKGGIFIAGGIAATNADVFEKLFMKEFTKHALPQYRKILENIPVTLITDYGISLKGAAFAIQAHYSITTHL